MPSRVARHSVPTMLIAIAGAAALGCIGALVLGHFVAASTLCITALGFGALAADR
jgi:hypothetical protein